KPLGGVAQASIAQGRGHVFLPKPSGHGLANELGRVVATRLFHMAFRSGGAVAVEVRGAAEPPRQPSAGLAQRRGEVSERGGQGGRGRGRVESGPVAEGPPGPPGRPAHGGKGTYDGTIHGGGRIADALTPPGLLFPSCSFALALLVGRLCLLQQP